MTVERRSWLPPPLLRRSRWRQPHRPEPSISSSSPFLAVKRQAVGIAAEVRLIAAERQCFTASYGLAAAGTDSPRWALAVTLMPSVLHVRPCDRMPAEVPHLMGMLKPYAAEPMEAYAVSTRVGNVKNTDAALFEPLEAVLR